MRSTDALLLAALMLTGIEGTLAADAAERVFIEADTMHMDLKHDTSTYQGNVRFRHGVTTLTGDRLVVTRETPGHSVVEVSGAPAIFERAGDDEATRAESHSMHYDETTRILTLRDEAVLDTDGQVIRSDYIRYDTNSDTLLAGEQGQDGSGQRVNITIDTEAGSR